MHLLVGEQRMLSRLTAIFQHAAEAMLAPSVSRPDEFQDLWKAITETITSNSTEVAVNGTSIPSHLERMVDLLCREEEEKDQGGMGPCMEFVLRHRILDTLCTTGSSDYPCGMRHQVLLFFTLLLGRIEQSLLPHISVHQAIQKLIVSCGQSMSSPVAADEVQFLRTLCLKLQKDPFLADFFLEYEGRKFLVTEALLRLVNSQDSLVAMKAYECLLTCVGLAHKGVTEAMATSHLPILLASQLQYHLHLIPSSTHYAAILTSHAGWGVDYTMRGQQSPHWHTEAFLSWLDYCEQVTGSADKLLADAVCAAIHEQVLVAVLLPKLAHSCEEDVLLATALLTKCLQTLRCERLLEVFVSFLLSEDVLVDGASRSLRVKLIEQCDHLSDEVCQTTLQLFDVLLLVPLSKVMETLVFQHWRCGRSSYIPRYLPLDRLAEEKQELQHMVQSYVTLVPDHLTSCGPVSGDSGLEQYLVEAQQQVAYCRALSKFWAPVSTDGDGLPEDPIPDGTQHSSQERGRLESEGALLTTLLNKLERLLDQPYEINLLLTSVLSKVASFPHPMVDNWLIATAHTDQQNRSVYSILRKVSADLQTHAERSPGMSVNLVEARRRLAGMETSDLLSMPHNDLLEGAIVLEEFVKEMACVVFAKRTADLLTLPIPLPPPQGHV